MLKSLKYTNNPWMQINNCIAKRAVYSKMVISTGLDLPHGISQSPI